jgi:Icc-related predicted phosphoesterase
MKICAISDLHGYLPKIDPCDLLLIAGDVCPFTSHDPAFQKSWLTGEFAIWMDNQPAKKIVWTAGNHDFALQNPQLCAKLQCTVDDQREFGGARIWCSPWTPEFDDWAFMDDEAGLARRYAKIPAGIDILVTHGPPAGFGDRLFTGQTVGSTALLDCIKTLEPRLVVFGHIHEGYGKYQVGRSLLLNVSLRDALSRPRNAPVYLEMDFDRGSD